MFGPEEALAAIAVLPPVALPLFVSLSAALEHVIPPYWGDTFILLGFLVAAQGGGSPAVVFGAAVLGSVLGAGGAFLLGQRYGMGILERVSKKRGRGRHSRRMQKLLEDFGERALVANRFLPVVRGFALYAAGMLGLRFGRVLLYSTISSLAWVALLMGIGELSAGTLEQMQATLGQARWLAAAIVIPALAAGLLSVCLRGRRRVRARES